MTTVSETLIDGDPERYEQRYCVGLFAKTFLLKLVRRPVSMAPPEGAHCFVDSGPRLGLIDRPVVAVYRNGAWKRVPFEPTHWAVIDD